MRQQQRAGVRAVTRHMQIVELDPRQLDGELRKFVKPADLIRPGECFAPIGNEFPHIRGIRARGPRLPRWLLGKPCASQALLEVLDRAVVDLQAERRRFLAHRGVSSLAPSLDFSGRRMGRVASRQTSTPKNGSALRRPASEMARQAAIGEVRTDVGADKDPAMAPMT